MAQADHQALCEAVADQIIRRGWGRQTTRQEISPSTQIYGDLGIHGDDFYELVIWVANNYNTDTNVWFNDYGPKEVNFPGLWVMARKLLGRPKPRYRSLSVGDVADIIIAGRWPE